MAANSNIQWTDHTFNPWIGCQKVTDACKFCYAEEFVGTRLKKMGKLWGPNADRHKTANSTWEMPRRWNRIASKLKERHKVFCASLADVFEDNDKVTEYREELWQLIRETPWLDWLILTKRPENIKRFLPEDWGTGYHNVWLGASVGSEKDEEMIRQLIRIPAVVRFLSLEPLLGPVDITEILMDGQLHNPLSGVSDISYQGYYKIDWVIVGGESGLKKNARPCNIQWILNIVNDCKKYNVPVLVKQLGSNPVYNSKSTQEVKRLKIIDLKGGDMNEFPEPLKVRQFPILKV
jgi:protein gp37